MKRTMIAAAALLAAVSAFAQVTVHDAWVRATVAQQKTSGAFMEVTSARDARLVGVRTPVAGIAEVHEMSMQDNVMRMRAVPALPLPAGKTVALHPGGFHVMLMDLKREIKAGDTVPLTLIVEDAAGRRQSVEVQATARPLNAMAHEHHQH